jgi:hypothetical protein
MDYQKLQKRAAERMSTIRERYQYARSLGFPAVESQILSQLSVEAIDRMYAEKMADKSKTDVE